MFLIALLFLLGILFIGLITFGGGQTFFAVFEYYFINILNRIAQYELITPNQLISIFGLTNATPGPFATKISGFLATLIAPNNIVLTIFLVIITYILITVPAALIMILVNNKLHFKSKRKLFSNIYKIMKPVTIAILIWTMISLINTILLVENMKLVGTDAIKILKVSLYLVISFIISFVCLYRFKVNLFLLIAFFGGFGFIYFYFIVAP